MTTTPHAPVTEDRPRTHHWLRRVLALVAAVLLISGGGALVSWWQNRDLRDVSALRQVDAEVTGEDMRRRLPDLVEVRYEAEGRTVQARIPGDSGLRAG
ncbi:MAG: hypothetical protein M3Q27_15345 [Actinomycetota bacterium]|nr:hypothetical protein [Actinomycetota bacterium]